jgi:hypothetical protein
MAVPYPEIFLALLAAYLLYSMWARLDSRYPIAMALGLLFVAAVADGLGKAATASAYAEYVFFLLAGAIALLVVDHLRSEAPRIPRPASSARGRSPDREAGPPANERQGTT